MKTMEYGFVFNLDPVAVHLGPFHIRYYGIIFATLIYISFILWRSQMLRGGHSRELAERALPWGVIAVLVGSRLGHCLFYEPTYYLSNPIAILYFWKGGLSSHGATIGLLVALFLFARKYGMSFIEGLDRFSMSAAVGAAFVRLGNFFNSEIVGRATDLPWAVRFVRYDNGAVARHPSQLYEFALGLFVLLVLYLADRWAGREKRPLGLLSGLFATVYFTGRFLVEFVKEHQVLNPSSVLTMGQYLSIPFFIWGVVLLVLVKRNASRPSPVEPVHKKQAKKIPKKKTKKRPKK